jgi:hypothetical protein
MKGKRGMILTPQKIYKSAYITFLKTTWKDNPKKEICPSHSP